VLCFDPKRDTFESLKSRAPFALTAMISVGALVRDGSKGESTVQRRCRDLARKMGG
jgi:hypothetical protein